MNNGIKVHVIGDKKEVINHVKSEHYGISNFATAFLGLGFAMSTGYLLHGLANKYSSRKLS
mgnify:CR=1 FL=1